MTLCRWWERYNGLSRPREIGAGEYEQARWREERRMHECSHGQNRPLARCAVASARTTDPAPPNGAGATTCRTVRLHAEGIPITVSGFDTELARSANNRPPVDPATVLEP